MITILNRGDLKKMQGEYVGRPSPLGNPYILRCDSMRDHMCDLYQVYFDQKVRERDPVICRELTRLHALYSMQGHLELVCNCVPKRCHAETIKDFLEAWDGDWKHPPILNPVEKHPCQSHTD